MTIIAPSILSADFLNLEREIKSFDRENDLWFHLDVMDGHFVPNLTFGTTILKNIAKITNKPLDAHFMVTNPEEHMEWFKDFGFHNFSFHWEAVTHHDMFLNEAKKHYPSVGVALNPSTPVELIPKALLSKIDVMLVMSVNPGFGGQKFIEYAIDKIERLDQLRKENHLNYKIQVDGGVSNQNSKTLVNAGADILVAGSYIFSEPNKNYGERISLLRS